jgi:hypothetical protein
MSQSRPSDPHATATREELYEKAKERDVAGRSSMTKQQLRKALREEDVPEASRVRQFRDLADAAGRDRFVMLPRIMSGHDRRLHVRQTLREDRQPGIRQRMARRNRSEPALS